MRTISETKKSLLLLAFFIAATIDVIFIFGEDAGTMSLAKFTAIKLAAMAAAFGLYKLAKWANKNGLVPEWYQELTEAITKED